MRGEGERFHSAVSDAALLVEEPAPFVEVAAHVGDVDEEHTGAVPRGGGVFVDDAHTGPVEHFAEARHAACDVDVFGVHEEALVEVAGFRKGRHAEEQEAAEQVAALEGFVVADAGKKIAAHTRGGEGRGKKPLADEVGGRREEAARVLQCAVGIIDFGTEHHGVGMRFEISRHGADYRPGPADIGVEHYVEVAFYIPGERDADVVPGTEATVFDMAVCAYATSLGDGTQSLVIAVVNDEDMVYAVGLKAGQHFGELRSRRAVYHYRGRDYRHGSAEIDLSDEVGEAVEAFGKHGAGTCYVPAHETLACGSVHGACVEPQFGFGEKSALQFVGGEGQCSAVHPHKICAFEACKRQGRECVTAEILHEAVVFPYVPDELSEPVGAVTVSRFGGDYAEGINVAYLIVVNGAVDEASRIGVRANDVGYLQACEVECLAGRDAYNCTGVDSGIGRVDESRHGEFAVNFVGDHAHIVPAANVAHPDEFVASPYTSGRVVRIAEEKQLHSRVGSPALEVAEVHCVCEAAVDERAFVDEAAVVSD